MNLPWDTFHCPICGKPSDRAWHPCPDCHDRALHKVGECCTLCGLDLAGADNPCPACRDTPHFLDGLVAVSHWSGPLREWLSAFKYGSDIRMANWLSELLYDAWLTHYFGLPVVPVPPRPGKIRREGRDQVAVLAKRLNRNGVPLRQVLKRRSGTAQKKLNRNERLSGHSLDFRFKRKKTALSGDIVVLDDVATTGATLEKCAELLKKKGALRVFGLVLCRD